MNVTRRACLLCVLLLSIAAPVAGRQLDSAATLRGRVLDPQGRGVVARVQVVQVSTGLERAAESVVLFVVLVLGVILLVAINRPLQAFAGFGITLLGLPAHKVFARYQAELSR